jgi:hypothetical protein
MQTSLRLTIFTLTLILFSSSVFAQTKTDVKKKKGDPYTSKEVWEPIPINRQGFHAYVDKQVKQADYIDGFGDNAILIEGKRRKSEILTKAILQEPKRIQIIIENLPLEHWDKIRYLKELEVNLDEFNKDFNLKNNKVDEDYYKDQMESFVEILKIEQEKGDMTKYINEHFNLGIYGNLHMFNENQEAKNLLYEKMVAQYPEKMLYKLREFSNTPAADALISNTAKNSPNIILTYAKSTSIERELVNRSKDPLVQAIAGLATNTSNSLKALPFINDIYEKNMTYEEVDQAIKNNESYFKLLVKSKLNEPTIGENVLNRELKHEALESFVREVNELHDESAVRRFKVTDNLSGTELYYLMVLCSDEIYTSSFTGLYDRMLERMKPQKGNVFLDSLNKDKFRTFIRMSAGYNKLDQFLVTMSEAEKNNLMASFVHNIDENIETDLEDAVDVADALASINDTTTLLFLQKELKKDYERTYAANNKRGLIIYFLLNTLSGAVLNPDDTTSNLQNVLKVPPITNVPYETLVDDSGVVYQQHFFYGDEDGRSSLASFLSNFPSAKWNRTNKEDWIKLESKSGKPVVIYMNQPLEEPKDEEAQAKLNEHLISLGIKPSIIVHRGHSYHLPSTLKYVGPNNKIVILGSCGGYHNLSTILEQSEDAHIVSSKQTGTMHVNDPMIRMINDLVSAGKGINWIELWKGLASKVGTGPYKELFNDYVPPHKNMGALFLKAFKIQMAENEG